MEKNNPCQTKETSLPAMLHFKFLNPTQFAWVLNYYCLQHHKSIPLFLYRISNETFLPPLPLIQCPQCLKPTLQVLWQLQRREETRSCFTDSGVSVTILSKNFQNYNQSHALVSMWLVLVISLFTISIKHQNIHRIKPNKTTGKWSIWEFFHTFL